MNRYGFVIVHRLLTQVTAVQSCPARQQFISLRGEVAQPTSLKKLHLRNIARLSNCRAECESPEVLTACGG
jgi:hypothetical protein